MNIDWCILNWIHDYLTCGFLDFLMPKVTVLGDKGIIWIVIAVALICIKKQRKFGILLILGLVIGVLVGNVSLKNFITRSRPCWVNTDVLLLIEKPTDFSFPSGHTLSSAIGSTILTLTNRKFAFFVVPLSALIAFSRLYLYVHFPSDILGAVCIGLIIGVTVFYFGRKVWDAIIMKVIKYLIN